MRIISIVPIGPNKDSRQRYFIIYYSKGLTHIKCSFWWTITHTRSETSAQSQCMKMKINYI